MAARLRERQADEIEHAVRDQHRPEALRAQVEYREQQTEQADRQQPHRPLVGVEGDRTSSDTAIATPDPPLIAKNGSM